MNQSELRLSIPQDKDFDVVGIGLNAVDYLCVVPHFPLYDSKIRMLNFDKQGGGQVATALVTCSKLGLKTRYVGKIGSDELGAFSKKSMENEGVDTSKIKVAKDSRNQFAFILVDTSTGERTIIWDRDPKLEVSPKELEQETICSGKILHLDGHDVQASIQGARWAKEAGIPVVLDAETVTAGTEELLFLTDILITSSSFPHAFTGLSDTFQALTKLQDYDPKVICTTLGKGGAVALYEGRIIESSGFIVNSVDTTGAGDVFHGAFIYGILEGWSLEKIMRFSNAAAALKCTKIGGREGIPTLSQVKAFLEREEQACPSS